MNWVMADENVSERAQYLLKVLIERYIRDGQPVGSRTLAEDAALSLSPATIRNIMADLEDKGFLHSPHTSAGRIPTPQAYRFFVDSLLTIKPLEQADIAQFQQQFHPDQTSQGLITKASNLLASITKLTGLVMLPRMEHMLLRHVEFLPLSEGRVLTILVLNEHEVQNRIIYTGANYSESELQQAANYLNNQFAGQDLQQIKAMIWTSLQQDKLRMDGLMQTAIDVIGKTFEKSDMAEDYIVAGQDHLLEMADDTGVERLRSLFSAFTEKHQILQLLDHCLNTEGVQIFIGRETGHSVLNDCSIVTAPYTAADKVVGVLGVIGPTRMPYERVIPIVDVTAKLLGAALNQSRLSPYDGKTTGGQT